MARYVMQRLLAMLLTLFIIVTVAFLVIRLMPSSIYDDPTISAEVLDMIQAKYHLDRPLIEQYGIFMKNVLLKGDWGISVAAHNSCQKWRTTHVKAYLCI